MRDWLSDRLWYTRCWWLTEKWYMRKARAKGMSYLAYCRWAKSLPPQPAGTKR